jgi:hypothetical protein
MGIFLPAVARTILSKFQTHASSSQTCHRERADKSVFHSPPFDDGHVDFTLFPLICSSDSQDGEQVSIVEGFISQVRMNTDDQ